MKAWDQQQLISIKRFNFISHCSSKKTNITGIELYICKYSYRNNILFCQFGCIFQEYLDSHFQIIQVDFFGMACSNESDPCLISSRPVLMVLANY